MVQGFHMGDFIRQVLADHKVNKAAVARSMGVKPQTVNDMLDRQSIGEAVLIKLGAAARIDVLGLVRREQARLSGRELPPPSTVGEAEASYGRRSPGVELVVNLEEYDEATQLKILRYLQQLPKKGE